MEYTAEIKIEGLMLKDPDKALSIFEEELGKAFQEATSFILALVKRGTPVHSGNLANSIDTEIRGSGLNLHGIVGTALPYSSFIETGRPPHIPNYANLADWVRLKLGLQGKELYAVLQVIARKISRVGVEPHWMFKRAFNLSQEGVQKILDKTAERIIKRWNE